MIRFVPFGVTLAAAFFAPKAGLAAGDWPMYRANAARSGFSSEPLPEKLGLLWSCQASPPAPAWPSSSRITFDYACQPIVAGGAVILGCSADDSVIAREAGSGRLRWRFFTEGPVRFAPAAWRDRLFVASDDGWLYALGLSDGSLLWKHRGGPNDRKCMGNGRMISRWPARGGPVVYGDLVYYAAGIWPSDGVYLHALDAATGKVLWINGDSGAMRMPQPHPGAEATSGVSPQGYLAASAERLIVPTGRSVPAAFRRADGSFEYYLLQENGSMGGARALLADRFVVNAGCFLDQDTGRLGARAGRGVFSGMADGLLRLTGDRLVGYQWADVEQHDRKGKPVRYRGLKKTAETAIGDGSEATGRQTVVEKLPGLASLDATEIRFREVADDVAKQTGLERGLAQARPDVVALGASAADFAPTACEREYEVIAAAGTAVCGGPGFVKTVDLQKQKILWEHQVEGNALGLAAAGGRLVVSTTAGMLYVFGDAAARPAGPPPQLSQSAEESSSGAIDYQKAAEEILRISGVRSGICIDLGCGEGQLARQLARQSELQIIGIDADAENIHRARRLLSAEGLYGSRVSIHCGDPLRSPYPRSAANLVVSSQALLGGASPAAEMERLVRPYGGVACFGPFGKLRTSRRGPLEGAGQWTHQNAGAANKLCSDDRVVGGPLEAAWYRDGALEIPDRHAQGPAPLFSQGYLVVEGVHGLCALDAYNGQTVWTFPLPGILADWDGVHHDVGVGDAGSNFCLSDQAVFVRRDRTCLKIDLATGAKRAEFTTPVDPASADRNWGYVAFEDGILYGSVLNDRHRVSPRYANISLRTESTLLFAMDAETGAVLWQHKPKHSIRNNAIAIAAGKVYLIDRLIAPEDRIDNPVTNGKHRPVLQSGQHPGGTLYCLDGKTGATVWRTDDDIFGTQLAVSREHVTLLLYYQAVKHNFFRLPSEIGGRMAAFDTASGARRWDRAANYKTRPMLNGATIYADGGAWNLLSGADVPWNFQRSYGCGQIASSTRLLLFRAATLGYFDLARQVGTENFGGMRPGCWFNAIAAGGLVLVPDGSSKCACSYQMQPWLALQERE